jgi:ankyrin repeat protein
LVADLRLNIYPHFTYHAAHCHARAQNGSTALILAADNGHTGFVRMLLDAGADKDAKNSVRVLDLWLHAFVFFSGG